MQIYFCFFPRFTAHTAEINGGRDKRRSEHKFEAVLRRAHYRGTYVDRKSAGALDADAGERETPDRQMASAQKVNVDVADVGRDVVYGLRFEVYMENGNVARLFVHRFYNSSRGV